MWIRDAAVKPTGRILDSCNRVHWFGPRAALSDIGGGQYVITRQRLRATVAWARAQTLSESDTGGWCSEPSLSSYEVGWWHENGVPDRDAGHREAPLT